MGDGMKRAESAIVGPTKAQRAALKSASKCEGGLWYPGGAGQFAMARRMANLGWGRVYESNKSFIINDAGRAAAKHGEG